MPGQLFRFGAGRAFLVSETVKDESRKMEQKTVQPAKRDDEEQEATEPKDVRNQELAEDTLCCLAEIDEVLDEHATEEKAAVTHRQRQRRQAYQEWKAMDHVEYDGYNRAEYDEYSRQVRIWAVKWEDVIDICCGVPRFTDDDRVAD